MTTPSLTYIASELKSAKYPEYMFGVIDPKKEYRQIVAIVHPDKHPAADQVRATLVFQEVQKVWGQAEKKMAAGTYGDNKPVVQLTVAFDRGKLNITGITRNDGVFKYLAAFDDNGVELVVKLPHKDYRSLAENDIKVLNILNKAMPQGSNGYSPVPHLITSFSFPVGKGVRLPALVLAVPKPSDLMTLTDINKAFPQGLDPRDMVWMLNRLLSTIHIANEAGICHGGLNPDNVWVSPEHHMGFVDGWHFATTIGSKVKAVLPRWSPTFTAPEILKKEAVSPVTDLYATSALANWLMSGGSLAKGAATPQPPPTTPRSVAGLLRVCLFQQQQRPYENAAQLFNEIGEVFSQLYGPKQFRVLTIPTQK